ncbi:MAG: DinB family protein, partial [Bacteroidia bacterium]|nr:DinB family protein [Bacteroidia bacterium]
MEIKNIDLFIDYFEKVRKRTLRVAKYIPKDKIEWTYKEGKFTFGDLLRHLATIERFMYAENAQFKPSVYPGCDESLASGYDNVISYMDKCHKESIEIFSKLSASDLLKKCTTPANIDITLWKWLRLMTEH